MYICATGQHSEAVREVLALYGMVPDRDLAVLTPGQSLGDLSARVLTGFGAVLEEMRPEWTIVQGDTATAAMAGLAAFYSGTKVAHVEAGLRSDDLKNPFPEEFNRRMISIFTSIHFAPTPAAKRNLLREGVSAEKIFVTGNTGIDALMHNAERLQLNCGERSRATANSLEEPVTMRPVRVLITAHRRENLEYGIENLCYSLKELAMQHPGRYEFVWPLHPNPRIGDLVRRSLSRTPGVTLTPPASYDRLLKLLSRCDLVLTDSGGLQEEAPSFGKPVLILRETTERPEGVDAGVAWLVGNDPTRIVAHVERLTRRIEADQVFSVGNPYGDGHAAVRIADYFAARVVQEFGEADTKFTVRTSEVHHAVR